MSRRFATMWLLRFSAAILAGALCPPGSLALAAAAVATIVAAPVGATRGIRELSYFALPLYGRQLARAQAIAPCFGSLAVPLGFALGAATAAKALPGGYLVALCLAGTVTALVAVSAALREGPRAWLYILLAWGSGAIVAGATLPAGTLGRLGPPLAALLLGFIALRQFGETLARYDPIETSARA
ncbi:MAG: hypothetical protein ACLPYS_10975 [Vulcanimicrobiaceae bacterium]